MLFIRCAGWEGRVFFGDGGGWRRLNIGCLWDRIEMRILMFGLGMCGYSCASVVNKSASRFRESINIIVL